MEILLNAGNGYGVAGLKLLRPMFERLVTMMHLGRNAGDVQSFLDYHHVQVWKGLKHIAAGGDDPRRYLPPDAIGEIEDAYRALPDRVRKRKSWSALDLATMAERVGLRREYVALSYSPTLQLHTSVTGISSRLDATESNRLVFRTGSQRQEADWALWGAHLCLSRLLEEQVGHFSLPVDRGRIGAIFTDCWPGEPGEPNPAGVEEEAG